MIYVAFIKPNDNDDRWEYYDENEDKEEIDKNLDLVKDLIDNYIITSAYADQKEQLIATMLEESDAPSSTLEEV